MLGEPENQFSLTRAALSTGGRAKSKFLSVHIQKNLQLLASLVKLNLHTQSKVMKDPSLRRTTVQSVVWLWLAAALLFQTANAATLLVYNNNDNGAGSLRQALADNQALGGGNTVTFSNAVTGNITLTGGQLVISTNVTILGPGAGILTVNGNSASRILLINGGTVKLSGLTLAKGDSDLAAPPAGGAGIQNFGTCAINNVAFLNNTNGNYGGAIYNAGTLTCTNCTLANGKSVNGGGLYNKNVATLKNCTISGNDTYSGSLSGGGGGIFNLGTLVLDTCTLAGNSGKSGGGAIVALGSATITSCSIVGNNGNLQGGGGVNLDGGTASIRNTIVAGNAGTIGPDCAGLFTSSGYNLIGKTNDSTGWGNLGDQLGSAGSPLNPLLSPLQDNSGPTLTMAPLPGSLAIDQGNSFGAVTDQRGRARPNENPSVPNAPGGDGSDIGAVETGATTLIVTTTNDSGTGSLRQMIANALPNFTDTIGFAPNVIGTITLTSGELTIDKSLNITGPGAKLLAVSGNNAGLVFDVLSGTVAISGLTVLKGRTTGSTGFTEQNGSDGRGGGIFNQSTLAMSDCIIISNTVVGGQGGGTASGFAGNGGNGMGGGIANIGALSLNRCTVTGNTALGGPGGVATSGGSDGSGGQSYGGGLYNFGQLALLNSTINGNNATAGSGGAGPGSGNGGGIYNLQDVALTNCTIAANAAHGSSFDFGGGIYDVGNSLTITSCTIVGNQAEFGGGINSGGANLANSILAGNAAVGGGSGPDGSGTINSSDYNLIQNTSTLTISGTTTHNITGQNPLLGALQDNGGPTYTLALLPGSPAMDKGKSFGLTADQRGKIRPADFPSLPNAAGGDGADIGAFEFLPASPPLNIQSVASGVVLSWPTNASEFRLESETNLASANWTSVSGTPAQIGGLFNLTNAAVGVKFYRLIFP
jgi:hypothetical protein